MLTVQRFTGSGAMNEAVTVPNRRWGFVTVWLHLSAAGGAGSLTITRDSISGPAFDTILLNQDMATVQDLVFSPDRALFLEPGDRLVFAWANANNRDWGLEVSVA